MVNPSENAFLILCKELNFTRAAERCFMSQQGLSAHIKKLEEQYGTKLFLRTPNVELTESGKALRLALLKKKGIEEDLLRTIREIDSGSVGKVRFGLNGNRAAFLAPKLLERYCTEFDKVEVHFTTGDTETLVRELREGRIDGLLGVNAISAPDLTVEPLLHEEALLILSDAACSDRVRKTNGGGKNRVRELSIMDLAAPDGPAFVRNEEGSTLNEMIDHVLTTHNIRLKTQAFISDYNVQLALCKTLGLAAFCPENLALAENGPADDPHLRVYRIRELKERMTISLVTDAGRYYPACAREFFRCVKRTLKAGN